MRLRGSRHRFRMRQAGLVSRMLTTFGTCFPSSGRAPKSGSLTATRRPEAWLERGREDVSRFLDHSSLAVTTIYLPRLQGRTTAFGRGGQWLAGFKSGPRDDS
jgi:hypothetical protein